LTSRLSRAAGKSPAYLARRAAEEALRRIHNPLLRRRIAGLDRAAIAAIATVPAFDAPGTIDPVRLADALARIERGEVDLLGSGPVHLPEPIDWHRDFKSGRSWPLVPAERIDPYGPGEPADVKVPWELSRGADFVTLARAWAVLRDPAAARTFERRLSSWLRDNPPGMGVNWASAMDVALRAVSWIVALSILDASDAPVTPGFRDAVLASLFAHGLWIEANLERGQVRGNHFVADALGLVAIGAVFARTADGSRWLDAGRRFLEEEIRSQVGEDGVDFEGSVAYHRLVLEMFLVGARLLDAAGRGPSPEYKSRLAAMMDFVAAYQTPEGLSPVVGDADDGRVLPLSDGVVDPRDHRSLLSAASPETRSRSFPDAGFHVLRTPDQYLFVDAGPVGSRGTGGHGHNDCLSFEWHAAGRPLLTDSGAYVYSASRAERNWFRSTAAHNAIRVDGEEINRIPSPAALFALSDDARPRDVSAAFDGPAPSLEASHTGYLRLADPVLVTRRFELSTTTRTGTSEPRLSIRDRVEGRETHAVEFFFHAAPGARALREGNAAVFEWPDGRRVVIRPESAGEIAWTAGEGWFSPSYGVKIARPYWVASARRELPLEIGWSLSLEPGSGLRVERNE
jgi:uncharacterized heparinase superfamily protein